METLHDQTRTRDSGPQTSAPAMPNLTSLHEDAARFLQDAHQAIDRAISGDSQAFLRDARQHPAQ